MVIGNLSSQNEILSMRANGIHIYRIFLPIVVTSLVLSGVTFFIADKMIPFTANQYRKVYSYVIKKMPSLELESYTSKQFGKIVISNGLIEGNTAYNVTIIDNNDPENSRVVTSDSATFELIDPSRFIYRITMKNPEILITDSDKSDSYSLAKASDLTLYFNLSSTANSYTSITPSQMSIKELKEELVNAERDKRELEQIKEESLLSSGKSIGNSVIDIESNTKDSISLFKSLKEETEDYKRSLSNKVSSFYYQYYMSELVKKIALSFACTCLVFIAFPLSFLRIKYGKLTGFGLSMLIACIYWFYLYFMHSVSISSVYSPVIFLWLPNLTVFSIGLFLIIRMAKK